MSGCGAVWLACLTGGQEAESSNLSTPTILLVKKQENNHQAGPGNILVKRQENSHQAGLGNIQENII